MIVADTDVLIDFLKGKGEVDRVYKALEEKILSTTAISSFELLSGLIPASKQEEAVKNLLGAIEIIPLSPESAARAAELNRELRAAGRAIGMADSLIAGICLVHNRSLLTRNKKHFSRVKELALE